jgi:hypothetical protein
MRVRRGGTRLVGVSISMTRRQLLVRTGGAGVALAGFGLLSHPALADPAALAPARQATYAALLADVNREPAYEIADRDAVVAAFAGLYAAGDAPYRAYVDATLDALEPRGLAHAGPQLTVDALTLVKRPFVSDADDLNQLLFAV